MDAAEAVVDRWLRSRYRKVVYEPDGNIPPDFLVDGRFAVEVRRLNQNVQDEDGYRSLDETSIPLCHKMKSLLKSLGDPVGDHSWFVGYRFARPVPDWKEIAPKIREALIGHRAIAEPSYTEYAIHDKFSIWVSPGSKKYDSHFCLSGYMDRESGGWLLSELQRNLKICITEKSRKVAPYRGRYEEWWLLFVDQITFGLDPLDREIWDGRSVSKGEWNRVVLIDPRERNDAYEI